MENKTQVISIFHGLVSIVAIIYYFIPIYSLIAAPFLFISIVLAASSRFRQAYKFGIVWIAIIGAIFIPMYLNFLLYPSPGYVNAVLSYLTLGFLFYSLVCISTVLLYKIRAEEPLKPKKKQGMIVGSDASHYCRYCGAEIKEGEITCPNCSSNLTED